MTTTPDPSPAPLDDADAARRAADFINATSPGTLVERMGIVYTEVSAQRVVATMPVAGNTQPFGLLNGGAHAVLAESLGSVGAAAHAGEGRYPVGIEVSCTHHRSVREGIVTGVATPLSLGRTLASYEVVMTDDQGRRLCTARLTALLRDV